MVTLKRSISLPTTTYMLDNRSTELVVTNNQELCLVKCLIIDVSLSLETALDLKRLFLSSVTLNQNQSCINNIKAQPKCSMTDMNK